MPWEVNKDNNDQNPWTDVLDMLLVWGVAGKSFPSVISSRITTYINSSVNFPYDTYGGGNTILSRNNVLKLSKFISDVKQGNPMIGNCSDCATLVRTLSNILGADLMQIRFGEASFKCNKIMTIGSGEWKYPFEDIGGDGFRYHEIASTGITHDRKVYDACLKVNRNALRPEAAMNAELPADTQFALFRDGEYRLLTSTDAIKYREKLIYNAVADLNNGSYTGKRECSMV